MAWTTADRDRLQAAIVALACGEQVQKVSYDGPPAREVTYHPVDLAAMRSLLAEMSAAVDGGYRPFRFATTNKGF
jgi:hypothetical protein